MCGCDWNYECMKCRMGVWPYGTANDPARYDQREEELERRERELSNPDFLKPYGEAQ